MDNKKLTSNEYGLNSRQFKFVLNYCKTGKKEKSAIDAGYSKRSAAAQATDLLKNPKIIAAQRGIESHLAEEACITPLMIILELKHIAFGNIYDVYTKLQTGQKLSDEDKSLLHSIKTKHAEMTFGTTDELQLQGYSRDSILLKLWDMLGFDKIDPQERDDEVIIKLPSMPESIVFPKQ